MEQNLQNDNNVLNMTIILDDMWRGFKKFFPLVILLVAACSAGAYYFFKMNYHPQYEAYKSMVVQAKFDYVYEDNQYNSAMANQMNKTFPYIITSGVLKDVVADQLQTDSIQSEITAEAVEDSSLFTIRVKDSDPEMAWKVLGAVVDNYPVVAGYILGDTTLKVVDQSGVSYEFAVEFIAILIQPVGDQTCTSGHFKTMSDDTHRRFILIQQSVTFISCKSALFHAKTLRYIPFRSRR